MRAIKDWKEVEGWQQGHHGPTRMVEAHDHFLLTGYGARDKVYVFKDGDEYFVLSYNTGLPYVGLEVFSTRQGEEIAVQTYKGAYTRGEDILALKPSAETFMQEHSVYETFGENGFDNLGPEEMLRVLMDYV